MISNIHASCVVWTWPTNHIHSATLVSWPRPVVSMPREACSSYSMMKLGLLNWHESSVSDKCLVKTQSEGLNGNLCSINRGPLAVLVGHITHPSSFSLQTPQLSSSSQTLHFQQLIWSSPLLPPPSLPSASVPRWLPLLSVAKWRSAIRWTLGATASTVAILSGRRPNSTWVDSSRQSLQPRLRTDASAPLERRCMYHATVNALHLVANTSSSESCMEVTSNAKGTNVPNHCLTGAKYAYCQFK